jgi:hypothetical protein
MNEVFSQPVRRKASYQEREMYQRELERLNAMDPESMQAEIYGPPADEEAINAARRRARSWPKTTADREEFMKKFQAAMSEL